MEQETESMEKQRRKRGLPTSSGSGRAHTAIGRACRCPANGNGKGHSEAASEKGNERPVVSAACLSGQGLVTVQTVTPLSRLANRSDIFFAPLSPVSAITS